MDKKLRASKAAVICYGFGDLASQFVWTFVGSYLTVFYTDVVGIAPLAVVELLPVIEAEMIRQTNQKIEEGRQDG